MTAVEWIVNELKCIKSECGNQTVKIDIKGKLLEQAKEMEKEQMLNAFQESRLKHPMIGFKHETFLDYYNETFKSE